MWALFRKHTQLYYMTSHAHERVNNVTEQRMGTLLGDK